MIACLDVHYHEPGARAACVLFDAWADATPSAELVRTTESVAAYQPGQFYLRELPCLLHLMEDLSDIPEIIVIDGYVWVGDQHEPGLGAHLYEALGRGSAVIGVAKSRYRPVASAREVFRGSSAKPLYVTAAGIDVTQAARHVLEMHGKHRIPTLLKRVDSLSRQGLGKSQEL